LHIYNMENQFIRGCGGGC